MAKCAKCSQRKGKRSCPALNGLICARCCGTYRLSEIQCPPDCDYLEGDVRLKQREEERSSAALDSYNKERMSAFGKSAERYATYLFESVVYRWWKDHRSATAEEVATSYERASRILGTIALPGDDRDTLAALLAHGVSTEPAFGAIEPQPSTELFVTILRRLADFARSYEERTSPWKGYYRGLEYVFSRIPVPDREELAADAESRPSSLILPGQNVPGPPGGGNPILVRPPMKHRLDRERRDPGRERDGG